MKVLVITPRYPYPIHGGDVLRIYNICKFIKENGHEIDLMSFYTENDIIDDSLKNIFTKIILVKRNKKLSILKSFLYLFTYKPSQVGYYNQKNFKIQFEKICNNYDKIISHLCRMGEYINYNNCFNKTILEMTDAISLNYNRSLSHFNGIKKAFFFYEMKKMQKYEQLCLEKFSKVVVVSDIDKNYLEKRKKRDNLFTITNGYDSQNKNFFSFKNKTIIFIGNMRTNANHNMVVFFVRNVLPEIQKVHPNVIFKVIGAEPKKELLQLKNKIGFEITGEVDKISDEIENSSLSVCPMFFGAGVQNKILESMAFGIPVVTTNIGLEGLIQGSEAYAFIANDRKEFITKINKLLNDKKQLEVASKKSLNFMLNNYQWNKIISSYLQ